MNNNALLRLQVRVQQAWADFKDGERGQTMVEYAGIALVVATIIGLIAAAANGAGIGDAVIGKIKEAIDNLHG